MVVAYFFITLWVLLTLCKVSNGGVNFSTTPVQEDTTNILPPDVQVSTFLRKGEPKTLWYWSSVSSGPLSLTVIPCVARIRWKLQYEEKNDTKTGGSVPLGGAVTNSLQTHHFQARSGLFSVNLETLDGEGGVSLYVSTEPGGPQPLQVRHPPLRLQHRQRRTQLSVKWNQSLVDPHVTNYCLVINNLRNYSTLCEALEHRYGPTSLFSLPSLSVSRSRLSRRLSFSFSPPQQPPGHSSDPDHPADPQVICVGGQTQLTLTNLEQGRVYYFNLFAINRQSNFTYPVASTMVRFNSRVKPTGLKDGRQEFVNLKKLDGKAVFRYKVSSKSISPLVIHVLACGGSVDVEVTQRRGGTTMNVLEVRRHIDSYGKLFIPKPSRGQRYYIRVVASNREELKRISGVEVMATTRPSNPLPSLPTTRQLHEYISMRRCDSVTVGWLPVLDTGPFRYCLQVKEGKMLEVGPPNQCSLSHKKEDFSVRVCKDVDKEESKVITQKISQLKSGRSYIIQVTVKKPKGRILSYDLLQVHTKKYCENSHKYN